MSYTVITFFFHARTVIPVFLLTAFQASFHTVHMVVGGAQQTDSFSSSIGVLVTQQRYFSLYTCLLACFETHVALFGLKLPCVARTGHEHLVLLCHLLLSAGITGLTTIPGLCGTSTWTPGFMHARQTFYWLSYLPNPSWLSDTDNLHGTWNWLRSMPLKWYYMRTGEMTQWLGAARVQFLGWIPQPT